ncbi:MAG: DNA polymerase III subunit gamma/tau [Candidatus Omnitrophica bacterium]|nr:DNA polymerase III subunit gamma/tau [Candidatus Omnitrophota bacterium]
MEYLAFALKYRPRDFDEVVGQKHVVGSLSNAIIKKRVHHAYLFSGPRGVGKTSMARILAKALNCHKGPTAKPCGQCPSCLSIAKGTSLDLIEIDGASNRGIDEIRTLRESVKLSPAGSRYKIYIIDEVHMLTQEAFNALLKTLEEPPAHVKFIFATTHPHKVLPTILSRCQKFQFNLFTLEEIVLKLKKITKSEGLKIQEDLLYTIGRAAGGSIRDAESLLDQLVPIILEKGSLDDVFGFLGIIDENSLNNMLQFTIEGNLEQALSFIDSIVNDGKDLGVFINYFIEHLRNLLLAKVSNKTFAQLSDVSPQTKEFILQLCKKIETGQVLRLIDLLLKAKDTSSRLNTVRIPFELALIKFILKAEDLPVDESPKPASGDKTEKRESGKISGARQGHTSIEKSDRKPARPGENLSLKSKEQDDFEKAIETIVLDIEDSRVSDKDEAVKKEPEPEEQTEPDDLLLAVIKQNWRESLNHMHKTRAAISSHLSFARPVSSRGKVVVIAFKPGDCFHKEIVESVKNLRFIEGVFSNIAGKEVGVKFILQETVRDQELELEDPGDEENTSSALENNIGGDDEFLNELLDTFGGKFQSEE